jgi:acyl carrier protein
MEHRPAAPAPKSISCRLGGKMQVITGVKRALQEALQIGSRVDSFNESTVLFGSIPEFDSMAVVTVVTSLEQQFDIQIEDDEITAEIFDTLGSLTRFIEQKLST